MPWISWIQLSRRSSSPGCDRHNLFNGSTVLQFSWLSQCLNLHCSSLPSLLQFIPMTLSPSLRLLHQNCCARKEGLAVTSALAANPRQREERERGERESGHVNFSLLESKFWAYLTMFALYTRSVPLCHLCKSSIPFIILAHVFIYIHGTFPTFHNKYLTLPTLFGPFSIEIKTASVLIPSKAWLKVQIKGKQRKPRQQGCWSL